MCTSPRRALIYPKMGLMSVPLSGVIVFFYRGLLELSKSFLDPWGNDGSEAQNVNIDVLLAEVHKDTPLWANAGQCAPITWKAACRLSAGSSKRKLGGAEMWGRLGPHVSKGAAVLRARKTKGKGRLG